MGCIGGNCGPAKKCPPGYSCKNGKCVPKSGGSCPGGNCNSVFNKKGAGGSKKAQAKQGGCPGGNCDKTAKNQKGGGMLAKLAQMLGIKPEQLQQMLQSKEQAKGPQ